MFVIDALRAALGEGSVRVGDAIDSKYNSDWSRYSPNRPRALLLPRSTEDVARCLAICNEHGQAVVPQGGLTGLVAGAHCGEGEIAISLERMSGIEELDVASGTMTVLAGTPLQVLQQAAEEAGFTVGIDIPSRGSCTVGGNVSTNAGGLRVVRYGMARQSVLGLEAVLANGTVIRSLNKMLKNNTGYDLKHLFIGSEGTLGIVTRVVLRLQPKPVSQQTAFVALRSFEDAIEVLHSASGELGGTLSAFELMWPEFVDFMRERAGVVTPVAGDHPMYLLIDAFGGDPEGDAERFERFLARRLDSGAIRDAVVATSIADVQRLWEVREKVSEYPRLLPGRITFDVSFPLSVMKQAVDELRALLSARWPDAVRKFYGHIGDSNLHLVVHIPNVPEQPHDAIKEVVYPVVRRFGGSVSAEHGIGRLKRDLLGMSRTPEEIALMRGLKAAMDPKGILNPGKVVDCGS